MYATSQSEASWKYLVVFLIPDQNETRKCTNAHAEKDTKKERKQGLRTVKHTDTEKKREIKQNHARGRILSTQSKKDHKPKTTHKFSSKGRGR